MEGNDLTNANGKVPDDIEKTKDGNMQMQDGSCTGPVECSDRAVKIGMALMLLLFISVSVLLYYVTSEQTKVANGTTVSIGDKLNESIGDIECNSAVDKTNKLIEDYLDKNINLTDPAKTVTVKLKDLGVSINIESAVRDIKDSLYTPYIIDSIQRHKDFSKNIPLVTDVKIDSVMLESFIINSLNHIEKKPVNADLFVNNKGEIEIKPDVLGCTLDKQKLIDNIISSVKEYNLESKTPTKDVTAELNSVTIKDLIPTKTISSYSTYYGGSDWGRKINVELGAKLINNALLKPGEEFEYWKYVGETTFERGFKLAGVYINGRLATGIGGGLCQVSTTLYNAALLADLEITERSAHGLPVYYVPLGLDATVSEGWYSLRFVNNTKKYMLIKSSMDGATLTFSIQGDMPEGKTVKIYAYNIGPKAADSYRDVYMNGKLIRHDHLGRDYYK